MKCLYLETSLLAVCLWRHWWGTWGWKGNPIRTWPCDKAAQPLPREEWELLAKCLASLSFPLSGYTADPGERCELKAVSSGLAEWGLFLEHPLFNLDWAELLRSTLSWLSIEGTQGTQRLKLDLCPTWQCLKCLPSNHYAMPPCLCSFQTYLSGSSPLYSYRWLDLCRQTISLKWKQFPSIFTSDKIYSGSLAECFVEGCCYHVERYCKLHTFELIVLSTMWPPCISVSRFSTCWIDNLETFSRSCYK